MTIRLAVAALVLSLSIALGAGGPVLGAEPVDLELVLAADGSGSITDRELAFQRQGYADAIANERILEIITGGVHGRIALTYIEWGSARSVHTIVPWAVIDGPEAAARFGEALLTAPRRAQGYNSISQAIWYSTTQIEENAYDGLRKIIDVSGDGPNRGGPPLELSRQRALSFGITINGLVINAETGYPGPGGIPLPLHYERDVIGGFGAFVEVAETRDELAEAILRKMFLEIAGIDHLPSGVGPTGIAAGD